MGYLILYGNCQSHFLHEILRQLPAITDRWTVVHHNLWATGEELERNLTHFDDCDTLLMQDVSNWHLHPRVNALPAQTKVITYPFVRHHALWPFDGADPEAVQGEGERQFVYQDQLLCRLRTEVPDHEERYQRYLALDVEDLPEIDRYAELEAARLLREDRTWGYSIGQWVLDNFQEHRLFHTVTHPTRMLWQKMAEEVLQKLGVECPPIDGLVEDFARGFQVPLHPRVVSELGLKWVAPDETYNFHGRDQLTFEQYVRRYIRVFG